MIALALAVLCVGAEPLDDGIAIYQSLEFERAAIHFQGMVLDPSIPPKLRAQAAMCAGLSLGQLGDVEGARRSFSLAVTNDREVVPPPGAPPALCAILEEERAAATARPRPAPPAPPDAAASVASQPPPPDEAPPPILPHTAGADWPAIGSGVAAGALTVAAVAAGVYGAVQYATSADPTVPARPAFAAYDAAVAAGWAAAGLGGVAVVAGGVSAVLFALE